MGTDYDSLLSKVVVCRRDLGEATQRAVHALRATSTGNENIKSAVKKNETALADVVAHAD